MHIYVYEDKVRKLRNCISCVIFLNSRKSDYLGILCVKHVMLSQYVFMNLITYFSFFFYSFHLIKGKSRDTKRNAKHGMHIYVYKDKVRKLRNCLSCVILLNSRKFGYLGILCVKHVMLSQYGFMNLITYFSFFYSSFARD